MNPLISLPGWTELHPVVVHFPIALLLVAPVLVILGLLRSKDGRGFLLSSFVLMVLGTIALYLAVASGQVPGEAGERLSNVERALERHGELAEVTRTIFTALTIIFGAILFVPALFKKSLGRTSATIVNLAFLVFYAAGSIVLANTAHQGGRLVHELGIRAIGPGAASTQAKPKEFREVDNRRSADETD
jgi:uncharacterized membrane protein